MEIGEACGSFKCKNLQERVRLDDLRVDGRLLKRISNWENTFLCVMYTSQDRDQSRVLLVVKKEEIFLTREVGSVGFSRSIVHHGVSLNVHHDCSSTCRLHTCNSIIASKRTGSNDVMLSFEIMNCFLLLSSKPHAFCLYLIA
jgi:hypothetical protein